MVVGYGVGVGNLAVSVGNLDWEIEVFEGILEDGDCFVAVLEGNYYYFDYNYDFGSLVVVVGHNSSHRLHWHLRVLL